ncbi:MAG: DUF1295 domain-containing protein [Pseudomonadales bacterium]
MTPVPARGDKRRDLLTVATGYLLATGAALLCVLLLDIHPLLEVLAADALATLVIFGCSLRYRNSSFYDPYWSVAPPLIAFWFVALDGTADTLRIVLVLAVVLLWAVRLTANWAWGWHGMGQQDWRYQRLEASAGVLWWPLSLVGIHLFPTLVVYLGCLPLYPALVVGSRPVGLPDAVAFTLGLGAVALEFAADRQLHRFRALRSSRTELLTSGVWGWCRHPNYLGEIGFWISLFGFGWAATGTMYPWTWLGPAAMLALFVGVSIPMIERKLEADKPDYPDYRSRTFALLPVPRRPA